ncbi:MAG: ribonuclease J [Pseudomonadota bacterium]
MAKTSAKDELVFLPLGGSGEIGMNMNLYGFGPRRDRQWIMIDCGVMFGDLATPGIDLICPDPSYILEERENLLGLLLTHGHEDHIGATALLAPELQCPLYATPFTAKLVEGKLLEAGVDVDLRVIDLGARFDLGPFNLEYLTLTHSIPEPNGVAIRTSLGNILHTGDWKIDPAPTIGPTTDAAAIKSFAEEGIAAMVCDSTNVFSPGESGSESHVKDTLTSLIAEQKGRVAVTTFASNFSRVVSICEAARGGSVGMSSRAVNVAHNRRRPRCRFVARWAHLHRPQRSGLYSARACAFLVHGQSGGAARGALAHRPRRASGR